MTPLGQLDHLRTLEDGWLDGEGKAPSDEGLDWLTHAFADHYPQDLASPYLYPTPDGGVQAEWSLSRFEVTLDVDFRSRVGYWHQRNMQTDDEDAREIRLDDPDSWREIVKRVRDLGGVAT
jgi:hypothetical protein